MKITDVKIDSMNFIRNAQRDDDDEPKEGDHFNVWFVGTLENGQLCHWGSEIRNLDEDMELKTIVAGFLSSVLNHLCPNREE